jgi:methanogenic corrinoid protein MtbC1
MKDVLMKEFKSESVELLNDLLDEAVSQFPMMKTTVPAFIDDSNEMGELSKTYLDLLLQGEHDQAREMIKGLLKEGHDIKDIYIHIFETVQHEVGRLWQTSSITVAQEHYITGITKSIMADLSPMVGPSEKNDLTMLSACIGDEYHDLGLKMVTDMMTMEGWETYFLGANTPTESIISSLEEYMPEVLSLSVTSPRNIKQVKRVIDKVRSMRSFDEVKIMVGGSAFSMDGDLWRSVGADGSASNAVDAARVAMGLVKG